ncbi:unnamed protein product, partial [Symbiodinium microadriaticum]
VEASIQAADKHLAYQALKRLKPWTPALKAQLKNEKGFLLSPEEELIELGKFAKKVFAAHPPLAPNTGQFPSLSTAQLAKHVSSIKPGKAVPKGSAPAATWKQCATEVAGALSVYCPAAPSGNPAAGCKGTGRIAEAAKKVQQDTARQLRGWYAFKIRSSLDDILQELRTLPELTEEAQQATHGCVHCDAAFASEYGLRLHIAKMHRNGVEYTSRLSARQTQTPGAMLGAVPGLSRTLSIKEHFGDTVRVEKRSARDRQVSGSGRCTPAPPPTTADEFSVRTFSNTSNSCYANAVVTSLCVLHARGRDFAALTQLMQQCSNHSGAARPLNLFSTFVLRNLLPNWRFDGRRQDASEFYMDLTAADSGDLQAVPWQGRIEGQVDPTDAGFTPIFLPIPAGGTCLGDLCASWHEQAVPRGLLLAPAMLALIVGRWDHASKNEQALEVAAAIQLPVWEEGQSRTMHTYRVEAGVYHIGPTIQAGHYRAFWYTPDRTGIWVSDDNARPQLAAASDRKGIREGSYVLFLTKQ